MVFSWSDLSSPIKVWLMPLTRLKNFKWFVLQKIILCMRPIVKFLFSDSTIFVTFVVSASDKKPSTKCQPKLFFCCGHHLKRKEARVSLFFSSWNNWKHWNSVFGIRFLIAGWCNERKIMLIFLFAYLTYLIYAIYSWTYVMFKKIKMDLYGKRLSYASHC